VPSCTGKTGAPGREIRQITSGGIARTFRLAVPDSYDASRATPLVLDFHGVLSNAAEQDSRSRLADEGTAAGYIVVTPDGYESSWNAEVCCSGAMQDGIDDVQFVRDVVADVEADYCVDPQRVFAAGYSNGGIFSFFLACRASDLIAAIASVDAASLLGERCQPERPVPILMFNGTMDPVVPYSVAAPAVAHWRDINSCSDLSETVYANGDSSCESWSECTDDAAVELCTVEGGGHTWPGGGDFPPFLGHKTTDLSATATLLDFFAAHPMH
jgi:polyhydroxybutyrate depolymerase